MTESLRQSTASLGVVLDVAQESALLRLLDELALWARAYNLTAIGARADRITHHLLDSLSVAPHLHGARIADLGTGAGFPGLPLAIACPERQFTLVDSTAKKIRFIEHAVRTLGLRNVRAVHARIEDLAQAEPAMATSALATSPPATSALAWDTLLARALAPLDKLLPLLRPLCRPETRVLAMCGRRPDDELTALPAGWRLQSLHPLQVPGLDAERHLLVFRYP